jgi:protein dithiol oxidoreductase (disulfide-forming)
MRRPVLAALLATVMLAACGTEPPADAANTGAAQAQPAAETQPVTRPAEAAPESRPAAERTQVAQADTARPPESGRFAAGQHYRVLNPAQPTSVAPGKVEVVDVFWYGCGGCYVMSPYMEQWKDSKPDVAEYVQLPATLNPGWQPHARLFFATKALGIEEQTHSAIFREVHVNRNSLNTPDLMVRFLTGFDVSEADARDALTGFSVDAELRAADVKARRYQLSFVPAFVVNGKYVVGVEQAGGPDSVLEVINYLVAKESGALAD